MQFIITCPDELAAKKVRLLSSTVDGVTVEDLAREKTDEQPAWHETKKECWRHGAKQKNGCALCR